VQAEQDDHNPGDDGELVLVRGDPLPEHRRAGAEAHEHGGEAHDEEHRGQHDAAPQVRVDAVLVSHLLDGGAAEIAEVGRHQRQHAGRQEAYEARQRDAEVDVDLREHRILGWVPASPCDIGLRRCWGKPI